MVVADLAGRREHGGGAVTVPGRAGRAVTRTTTDERASLSGARALRAAASSGPRGLSAIVTPGSANDPRRVVVTYRPGRR